MSGVAGRSGATARPVAEHLLRGTHRRDRHGVVGPSGLVKPAAATPATERPGTAASVRSALPKAPAHLRAATRRWFRHVVTTWSLESHHVKLLELAAVCWDRCEAAREQLAKDGVTVKSARGGPRLHPALRIEETNRRAFARLLAQLDLEDAPEPWRGR